MRARLRREAERVGFVLEGVEPRYEAATRALGFQASEAWLVRWFPSESQYVDEAFAHFHRHVHRILRQAAGEERPDWEGAIDTLCGAQEASVLDWFLGGSAALAVRGIPLVPGDVDVITSTAGASQLASLLRDHLVEPYGRRGGDWISEWWGRAFLGARLEWVGNVHSGVDSTDQVTDYGPTAASHMETVEWRGHRLRVPPLVLQLDVARRRGLEERVRLIEEHLRQHRR